MPLTSHPASASADALRQISETTRGERSRRAAAGALVLRAVEQGHPFVAARALREVAALPAGAEASVLRRILILLGEFGGKDRDGWLASYLVGYACELERTHRLAEADAALALARALAPDDAEAALHAGRIARKLGDRERALLSYGAARALDGAEGRIARLAGIGEAIVSAHPLRELRRAVRDAVLAGDTEAAGVALEERARIRRAGGDRRGAGRDLCVAALRYPDAVDRARVAHELADVLLALRDPAAAREALETALALGDAPQREHAQSRLHTLARDGGDEVGARRWRSFRRPSLISLSVGGGAPTSVSAAPRLRRWRELLQGGIER